MLYANAYGPYRMFTGSLYVGLTTYDDLGHRLKDNYLSLKQYLRDYSNSPFVHVKRPPKHYYRSVSCSSCQKVFTARFTSDNIFRGTCSIVCANKVQKLKKKPRLIHPIGSDYFGIIRHPYYMENNINWILHICRVGSERKRYLYRLDECVIEVKSDEHGITWLNLDYSRITEKHELKQVRNHESNYWISENGIIVVKRTFKTMIESIS